MNCQHNCNKLKKKISKLGLFRIFFWNWAEKTLGSAWKISVGRVSGNKELFFYALLSRNVHAQDKFMFMSVFSSKTATVMLVFFQLQSVLRNVGQTNWFSVPQAPAHSFFSHHRFKNIIQRIMPIISSNLIFLKSNLTQKNCFYPSHSVFQKRAYETKDQFFGLKFSL